MNEPSNTPMGSGMPSASEPFYQTWIKAITKPNEQTYTEISDSPSSNPNSAYLWMAASGAIGAFFSAVANTVAPAIDTGTGPRVGSGLVAIILSIPLGAVIGVVAFAIGIAIIQWIAKLFGGVGSYSKLVYLAATYGAPLGLISGVVSALTRIPVVGLCFTVVSIGLGIYAVYLEILSVKVVNKLDWGKATATVLIPVLVLGVLCACLVAAGISLFAAALSGAGQ